MSGLYGAMPKHWGLARLDRVASVHARIGWKALTAAEYVDEGFIFLSTPNIKSQKIDFKNVNYISDFRYQESPELMLQVGDVLLVKDGSTLGITNLVGELPRPATVNGSIAVIRPHEVKSRFLRYVLASAPLQGHIQAVRDGMGVPHLFQRDINRLEIPMPPPEEQEQIADFLDDQVALLNCAIDLRRRQVGLAEERHEATWTEAMEETPQDLWHPLRRFLLSITDGPFGSSLTSAHYTDEGARVIRLGNIGVASFRDQDKAFISYDYFNMLRAHAVEAGDLLIAGLGDERHPLGRACVAPAGLGSCIVKADCYRVRLDERRLAHDYAALAISSPVVTSQTVTLSHGSTRARINTQIAREIKVPVPEHSVQVRVVARLRESSNYRDRVAELNGAQSSLLMERRQALITAAVTGQFNVTTARSVA